MTTSHLTLEQRKILVQIANALKGHLDDIDRSWTESPTPMAESVVNLRRRHLHQFVNHISTGDFEGWKRNLHEIAERLKQQKVSLALGDSLHFCDTASCLSYLMQEFPQQGEWRSMLLAIECFQNDNLAFILRTFDHVSLPQKSANVPIDRLTAREKEVLRLVVEGLSSKEIAYRLRISVKTVEAHRANLMKKLGINSVVQLVRYAYQAGPRYIEPLNKNLKTE